MRFSIIPFFLMLFVSSFLAAQAAPAPTPQQIVSEDDLKLGIYDAPIFQPAARNFTVRQAEGNSKDGELLFVLGEESYESKVIQVSPSYIRLYLSCYPPKNPDDALSVVYELLSFQKASRVEVVVHH